LSSALRGVSGLAFDPGDYVAEPAEWRRDAGQQLQNLTGQHADDDESEDGVWHLHDVRRADGSLALQVYEDRRSLEGSLQTNGRRVIFRSPDGETVMAFERDGYAPGATTTLEEGTTGEVLGSWETPGWVARFLQSSWRLANPNGTTVASATRSWSLGTLFGPSASYTLETADGVAAGEFAMDRDGLFAVLELSLERSAVPAELLLAMSYGIFWGLSQ
jgi:hypothetical protein